MPAPAFVAVGAIASGTTSMNVAYYSGVAENHIALIWASAYATGGGTLIGTVSGWTALAQIDFGEMSGRLYWKRLVGSESGTVTVDTADGELARGFMVGISGAIITGTPYEGADSATGNGRNQTSATIVTTEADRLGIRAANFLAGDVLDPPSGWTERLDNAEAFVKTFDTKDIAAAGTEAASTRTYSGSFDWIVQTLAIIPEPSGQPYAKRIGGVLNMGHGHNTKPNRRMWREALSGLFVPERKLLWA